jgi:hypothetical protein
MVTITISRVKYEQLKRQAEAYRRFAAEFFKSAVQDSLHEVVEDFRKSNLYSEDFLQDLEVGLRKSSYGKGYGNKTITPRSRKISSRT